MSYWLFNTDEEGWSTTGNPGNSLVWTGDEGVFPGCLYSEDIEDVTTTLTIPEVTVQVGDVFSFYARLRYREVEAPINNDVTVTFNVGTNEISHTFSPGATLLYDSGFIRISGVMATSEAVTLIYITCGSVDTFGIIYIDNIYFLESDVQGGAVLYYGVNGIPSSVSIEV